LSAASTAARASAVRKRRFQVGRGDLQQPLEGRQVSLVILDRIVRHRLPGSMNRCSPPMDLTALCECASGLLRDAARRAILPEMSDDLLAKTCVPCRGGVPPLTRNETETYLQRAPGWTLVDDGRRIERTFNFRNFKDAMDFVAKVGALSETEGHHPEIAFGWGRAKVSWQTKKIGGLHENDFIMAAKTSRLADTPAEIRTTY
jgi:4a-hydroxytetrahydrobiopterin dehydratase